MQAQAQADPIAVVEARADLIRSSLTREIEQAIERRDRAELEADASMTQHWNDRARFVAGLFAAYEERRAGVDLEQETRDLVAREQETETTVSRLLAQAGRTGAEILIYEWADGDEENGPVSLRDALSANVEDDYVVSCLLEVEVGGEYQIGGGAAPLLTVRRSS